jgi:hypothetical protein
MIPTSCLPMLGFECSRLSIDFTEALATERFGGVGHRDLLGLGFHN